MKFCPAVYETVFRVFLLDPCVSIGFVKGSVPGERIASVSFPFAFVFQ